MTRKPHGHVRILIYRTWAITTSVDLFSDFGVHFENQRFCLMSTSFGVWGLLKSAISFSKSRVYSKTNFYELGAFGDPLPSLQMKLFPVAKHSTESPFKHCRTACIIWKFHNTAQNNCIAHGWSFELHNYNQGFDTLIVLVEEWIIWGKQPWFAFSLLNAKHVDHIIFQINYLSGQCNQR